MPAARSSAVNRPRAMDGRSIAAYGIETRQISILAMRQPGNIGRGRDFRQTGTPLVSAPCPARSRQQGPTARKRNRKEISWRTLVVVTAVEVVTAEVRWSFTAW